MRQREPVVEISCNGETFPWVHDCIPRKGDQVDYARNSMTQFGKVRRFEINNVRWRFVVEADGVVRPSVILFATEMQI